MPVYRIDSFDGDKGGLDFGEFWHDPALVANVVLRFSAKFLARPMLLFPAQSGPWDTRFDI